MQAQSEVTKSSVSQLKWFRDLAQFEKPEPRKAIWQLLNTLLPYLALWGLMVWMVRSGVSYWFVLPLVVLASGLLIRIFIFFHDCCHGSFFPTRGANRLWGYICGVLVFTPYEDWRHHHAGHHATSADLDRRGIGDIWTMTVDEYYAAPRHIRIAYRIFRNPIVLFGLGPPLIFMVLHRFAEKGAGKRERRSVALTNLALLTLFVAVSWILGWRTFLSIQIPVICLAGAAGIWLFYVQHQFENDYWARHETWDPIKAAMEGSSYYKLPKVLQWITGNIGLHHIHHLRPRIPNYNLQLCYDKIQELQVVEPLTLPRSLHCLWMNLWDETQQKMVSFRTANRQRPANQAQGSG